MAISTRKLTVAESVVCAEVEGEAVLLNVASGVYYGLDSTGTFIWQQLTEGCTEAELRARLLAEYDVEAEELRRDVSDFLGALASKGLLWLD